MLDVGRVCLKIAGREAGKYCVVVKKMDESFVMITGPKELTSVKRRRCNISHLEPLIDVIKIKSDAPDNDILKAYQDANLTNKLGLEPGKARKVEAKKAAKKEPRKEVRKVEAKKEAKKPAKAPKKKTVKKAKPPVKKAVKKAKSRKTAKKK